MVSKYLKPLGVVLSAALLLASSAVRAVDDTEIYISNTATTGGGTPLVFFYIEYTPNLASTICTGVTSANIDTACPQIAPIKIYMSPNDLNDGTIDQFELTRAALKRVVIGLGGMKIGLLMAHDNLASCAGGPSATQCSQGGYILKGLTPITAPSTTFNASTATATQLATELSTHTGKAALFDKLDALPSPQGGFSHENQNKEIYFELFRYLTGQAIYNGHNGWVDYGSSNNWNLGVLNDLNPSGAFSTYNCVSNCSTADFAKGTARFVKTDNKTKGYYSGDFAPLSGSQYMSTLPFKWDDSIEDGSLYRAALTTDCEKVYVINVIDGGGNSANDADTAIKAAISSGGMNFNVSNSDTGFVEMVRWLHDKDLADGSINPDLNYLDRQNVTSYFIAKQPQQVDQAAQAGGSGYATQLTDNAQSVIDAINNIFDQINDASTTFTAAAIPVNVFNRSEVLDNAYIALFQPNDNGDPRWVGNVKKLKMQIYQQCAQWDAVDPTLCIKYSNRLRLVDTTGVDAISSTGRIDPNAITFWTKANGYDLYDNLSMTNGVPEVAGHDGRSVNRGGAGQQIPGFLNGWANWDGTSYGPYNTGAADSITGHIEAGIPLYRNVYTEYLTNTATGAGTFVNGPWMYADAWLKMFNDPVTRNHWSTAIDYLFLTGDINNDVWGSGTGTGTGSVWGYTMLYAKNKQNALFCNWWLSYPNGICPEFPMVLEFYALYYQMYGVDVWDENHNIVYDTSGNVTNTSKLYESRRWLMGDPLHSRPLPINYGIPPGSGYTSTNQDIRILVGGNDGFMRMIRNTNSDGSESGQEVWAFMPQDVMKTQKQLMDNVPYGTPFHPYGVDGSPTAYVKDSDGNIGSCTDPVTKAAVTPCDDEVLAFFGLRRGGNSYYGLNITVADKPSFMWKVWPGRAGYSELGYTFSQPVVRELDWGLGRRAVLIIGGGYDTNKDYQPALGELVGTNDSMGNAVYIIDAHNGNLIWKVTGRTTETAGLNTVINANMVDSIPSEVSAIDSDNNGLVDRIYVGDTGGRVWRIDLPGTDRTKWQASMLLDVGRHVSGNNNLANDRRFFYAPDVVPSRDANGYFDAVVIGSGNREHPRQTTTNDYMYMYKDRTILGPLSTGFTAITPGSLGDVTNNCYQEIGITCTLPDLTTGWKLKLQDSIAVIGSQTGEKSLASPLTLRGVIYFSTYVPTVSSSGNMCSPQEGIGYQYAISLQDAIAVYNYDTTNSVTDSKGVLHDLQIEDRRRTLDSPGIPSEDVYISFTDTDASGNKRDVHCVLSSDLKCSDDLGAQTWSTYWFEKQK